MGSIAMSRKRSAQDAVLALLKQHPNLHRSTIAELLSMTPKHAGCALYRLSKRGEVKASGMGWDTTWKPLQQEQSK